MLWSQKSDLFAFLGCDESCASTCTHGGPTGCKKCKGGYNMVEEKGCQGNSTTLFLELMSLVVLPLTIVIRIYFLFFSTLFHEHKYPLPSDHLVPAVCFWIGDTNLVCNMILWLTVNPPTGWTFNISLSGFWMVDTNYASLQYNIMRWMFLHKFTEFCAQLLGQTQPMQLNSFNLVVNTETHNTKTQHTFYNIHPRVHVTHTHGFCRDWFRSFSDASVLCCATHFWNSKLASLHTDRKRIPV